MTMTSWYLKHKLVEAQKFIQQKRSDNKTSNSHLSYEKRKEWELELGEMKERGLRLEGGVRRG